EINSADVGAGFLETGSANKDLLLMMRHHFVSRCSEIRGIGHDCINRLHKILRSLPHAGNVAPEGQDPYLCLSLLQSMLNHIQQKIVLMPVTREDVAVAHRRKHAPFKIAETPEFPPGNENEIPLCQVV